MAIVIAPNGKGMGYKPDLGDIRDYMYAASPQIVLPARVDMRDTGLVPPLGDQLALGSCTAWATLRAYRSEMLRQGARDMDGSELAQYYWTRQLEDTVAWDSGASLRNSVKTVVKTGMVAEQYWSYDISKFKARPTVAVRNRAHKHQAVQYQSVPVDVYALKAAVAEGLMPIIGISVYRSFMSSEAEHTGVIPMPQNTESMLGGHAMNVCGFNDAVSHFIVPNQWGLDWGDHGFCYIPYDYLGNPQLGGDYWVIRQVEV